MQGGGGQGERGLLGLLVEENFHSPKHLLVLGAGVEVGSIEA
jgi:hypothetical protein